MSAFVRRLVHVAGLMQPARIQTIARRHPELKKLLTAPYFASLLSVSPKITKQYLASHLVRSFDVQERLAAVIHHYEFIKTLFKPTLFKMLLDGGMPVWTRSVESDEFRLILKHNIQHFYEGDILLILFHDDLQLFQVSCSVVSGTSLGMGDGDILLLGSAQGVKSDHDELKYVVKASDGVAPSHLVMAAARGVAQAIGVSGIAGVSNADQIVKTQKRATSFSFDYDAFWPMFGGELNEKGIFVIPVETFEKPLLDIPRTHRRRSRKKREFKAVVTQETEHSLRCYLVESPVLAH